MKNLLEHKTTVFVLLWLFINMLFVCVVYATFFCINDQLDIELWIEEAREFFFFVVFIFALISLKIVTNIINKL